MPAKPLSDVTTRQRDVRAKLEWRDLKALIARQVMADLSLPGADGVDGLVVKIDVKQEERGSPGYRIDEWSAVVTVTMPV